MVTDIGRRWLLLLYKIPPEPTANRVAVWRKLKRLGAVLLHDALWVLPPSPRTFEEFQWLASEVSERGGEAMLWEGTVCLDGHEDDLIRQFLAQVDAVYADILASLREPEADLAVLSRRYQQARAQDYFHSPLGQEVRQALLAAGGRAAP